MRDSCENTRYLPGVKIPASVKITPHFSAVVADAEILVLAVPSHGMRELCERIAKEPKRPRLLVNVAKGIEMGTHKRMSEIVMETLGAAAARHATS